MITFRLLQGVRAAATAGLALFALIIPSPAHGAALGTMEVPPLDPGIGAMMKTNSIGTIEARIYLAEQWQITPVQKAQVFLTMLRQAEPEDQRKLAHAAVRNVTSPNYGLVRRHLLDPKLPREVLSVFMTDTLKRPYEVKLPALLALGQVETHPLRAEAQDLLRRYLGRDHGTNWPKWEETMLAWLEKKSR